MTYRIGVDLGGTNIAVGIVDEAQRIVGRAAVPTVAAHGAAGVADDIVGCIDLALADAGAALGDCAAVGVGSPGNCDTESGVARHVHNLGWESVPLGALLHERTGLPAFVGNDADCAALGEVLTGAARGCASALLLTLGTGVGGGFVLNGRIFSGSRTLGGEFGHMCIAMDGEKCVCGQRGCWEAYASATALIRQAKAAAAAHPESVLARLERLDGRSIYAAAAAGDPTAQAVTARYAAYVGVGLVNLINALFPEVILLGGGVAGAGEALLAPVRDYAAAHFFAADPALLPPIRPAALGNDAGIIGAAALGRN